MRPLVSATDLAAMLDAADRPAVLDVRWELATGARRDEYAARHIPGARFLDLDRSLASAPGPGGRYPLPNAAAFQASMRAVGVGDRGSVVVYDAATSMAAARGWWLLRYFGHPRVAVLDGGLAGWAKADLP